MASFDMLKWTTGSVLTAGALYILYKQDLLQTLPPTKSRAEIRAARLKREAKAKQEEEAAEDNLEELAELPLRKVDAPASDDGEDTSAWFSFASRFENFTSIKDIQWEDIQEGLKDYLLPDWAKELPENMEKLQRELSMAPGSLADEIWKDALNPDDNPEVARRAKVRISEDLCDEEKEYLKQRRKFTTAALAKYLGIPEEEINPADVPVIAMCSSGGGLRALVASTGSMAAASEAGLFDCVTYTAGVSGSCWMQALYHSSLGRRDFSRMIDHLKARLGTHIAYPPVALSALNSAPTNKFLLSGFVEKLKGDPNADFGIVDVYGLLLAARLLVPKGELGVDNRDLKMSNQRANLTNGQHPMPIYTAVRHEIPILEEASDEEKETDHPSEETKEKAKRESWFQWFEITPYEFFCEEFSAGIPTWSMGRKFKGGSDLPLDTASKSKSDSGLRPPELKLPLLLGVFGSAMCATLSHYAREVKPVVRAILPAGGFTTIQEMIEDRSDDLSLVHPIDPASIPNPYLGLEGRLPATAPESIHEASHLQLMDAGMSNNLPIFPVLRPGRDVDIVVAFDASADIKTENWLSQTEGYAKQRGIKGWPIGAGWPKGTDTVAETTAQLNEAETASLEEAEKKVEEAKHDQEEEVLKGSAEAAAVAGAKAGLPDHERSQEDELIHGAPPDLGHCSVWVGTTAERVHSSPTTSPPSKKDPFVAEDWELMEPDAGIAVVYFPFIANEKVEGVDPATSPFMSTWNFVYTEEDVENTVRLARENFGEGREQTRRVVRAVYERKKRVREERERKERHGVFRRKLRLGVLGKKEGDNGQGDQFR